MKKSEVLKALDTIYEMSDKEISINAAWIKEVAISAYSLIKQKDTSKNGGSHANS